MDLHLFSSASSELELPSLAPWNCPCCSKFIAAKYPDLTLYNPECGKVPYQCVRLIGTRNQDTHNVSCVFRIKKLSYHILSSSCCFCIYELIYPHNSIFFPSSSGFKRPSPWKPGVIIDTNRSTIAEWPSQPSTQDLLVFPDSSPHAWRIIPNLSIDERPTLKYLLFKTLAMRHLGETISLHLCFHRSARLYSLFFLVGQIVLT